MPDPQTKYARSLNGERLWQGEILSNLIQARVSLDSVGSPDPPKVDEMTHPFAVVLTQDCDLLTDYNLRFRRATTGSEIPNILFCEVTTAESLRARLNPGSQNWKRIIQNKDERYQCLEGVPIDQDAAGHGADPLGIDFKRYFTIPTDEVYKRLELGQVDRRSRLISPYLEQFATRFFYYQYRVALPENHDVQSPRPPA
jgi:hypothetical protein